MAVIEEFLEVIRAQRQTIEILVKAGITGFDAFLFLFLGHLAWGTE